MISAFEYVTVLISIVLSLGITQILTGVASLIKKYNKVIVYWPHLIWILFVLLLHIQEWWVTYELKPYSPWRLPVFLFIMMYPINLFVLARLLLPDKLKGKVIDLKVFYYKNYRKIFLLLILSAVLSVIYNLFILNLAFSEQILQILLILVISLVAVKNYKSEWIHKALSIVILVTLVISIVIEWNVWLIE